MKSHVASFFGLTTLMTEPMADQNKGLRLSSVLDRTGLSGATIYRMVQQRKLPQQAEFSEHSRGWREGEFAKCLSIGADKDTLRPNRFKMTYANCFDLVGQRNRPRPIRQAFRNSRNRI